MQTVLIKSHKTWKRGSVVPSQSDISQLVKFSCRVDLQGYESTTSSWVCTCIRTCAVAIQLRSEELASPLRFSRLFVCLCVRHGLGRPGNESMAWQLAVSSELVCSPPRCERKPSASRQ